MIESLSDGMWVNLMVILSDFEGIQMIFEKNDHDVFHNEYFETLPIVCGELA